MTPHLKIIACLSLTCGLPLTGHGAEANGCNLTLSDSELDYGHISPAQLKQHRNARYIDLPTRTFTLTAHCKQSTAMRIAFDGIGTPGNNFQLGRAGEFSLAITRATLDGKPTRMHSPESEKNRLLAGETLTPQTPTGPAKGKNLELQIRAAPRIDTYNTRATDELRLQGQGQFRLDTP